MHDGDVKRWFGRMIDAGWRFWLWQEDNIMWRHADEYGAWLSIADSERYALADMIPDPYDILRIRKAA